MCTNGFIFRMSSCPQYKSHCLFLSCVYYSDMIVPFEWAKCVILSHGYFAACVVDDDRAEFLNTAWVCLCCLQASVGPCCWHMSLPAANGGRNCFQSKCSIFFSRYTFSGKEWCAWLNLLSDTFSLQKWSSFLLLLLLSLPHLPTYSIHSVYLLCLYYFDAFSSIALFIFPPLWLKFLTVLSFFIFTIFTIYQWDQHTHF